MGHERLGRLPRTKKWKRVVALLAEGAGVRSVSHQTLKNIRDAVRQKVHLPGLAAIVWLLSQVVTAGKAGDVLVYLRNAGIHLQGELTLHGLAAAFTQAVDANLKPGQRTDVVEMAQAAAVEALYAQISDRHRPELFASTGDTLKQTLAGLTTVARFGALMRCYHGKLYTKIVQSFLTRVLGEQVGGDKRFTTVEEEAQFGQDIGRHCHEAALIVEKYAGEWLSKWNWLEDGISRERAGTFAAYARKKMIKELLCGGEDGR